MKILHIITKLEVGGAQQNTIYTVEHLNRQENVHSEIIAGPIVSRKNLMKNARDRGINVTVIKGITNEIRPIKNLTAMLKAYKHIRKGRFDIVHTHSSVAGIIGRIAARLAKTPVIIHTVHGWGIRPDLPKWKLKIYILLERICARFTHKLITVSERDIRKGLKNSIGKKSQYTVIRSGIDISRFSKNINKEKKKKELGIDPKKPVVGMVGRLDKQKNPLDFVRAASKVQKKHPEVQFIIAGDGPLRKQTESLIKKLKVNNFHILGFRDDVNEIIQILDISVLTSLWEGLPRVFPESMAAKKPIIATDVDGAREAIINSKNGFITQPKKPEQTAEKIYFLLQNPKKAKKMGENGFAMAEKFSLKTMLNKLYELYQRRQKMSGIKESFILKDRPALRNALFKIFQIINITARKCFIPLIGYNSSEKIVSERYRFVCITIPICGRTTLLDLFRNYFDDFYITKKPLSRLLKRNPEYNNYFKFTIIRNPWSRTVSCYNKRVVNINALKKVYLLSRFKGLNPNMTFKDFIRWLNTKEGSDERADKHWKSPHKFLMDGNGKIRCDYVGKLESLSSDLEIIFQKIGLKFSKEWIGKKASSYELHKKPAHKDYRDYYDKTTRELIRKRYKEYIRWSGYKFTRS